MLLPPTMVKPATVPSAHSQPPSLATFSLRSQSTPRSASVNLKPGTLLLLALSPRWPLAFSRPKVNTSTVWPAITTLLVKPMVAEPLRLKPSPRAMLPLKL